MADSSPPVSRSIVSQGLRLHYLDWGNPQAPLLVLQHGAEDHARSWAWTAETLRGDWHVIAPDLRGHGESAWSPDGAYLSPYYTYDLAELIRQQDVDRVTLVGHSLGGAIVLRYAGLYPETVDRVVAIEGLGISPAVTQGQRPVHERWLGWIAARRQAGERTPRRFADPDEAIARMRAKHPNLDAARARDLTIHNLRANDDGSYSWRFDPLLRAWLPLEVSETEQHALWQRIACPVLLAYGRDSWASNPAEDGRAAWFRDSRVVIFDKAGHWLHHDRFDAFVAEVHAFLAPDAVIDRA